MRGGCRWVVGSIGGGGRRSFVCASMSLTTSSTRLHTPLRPYAAKGVPWGGANLERGSLCGIDYKFNDEVTETNARKQTKEMTRRAQQGKKGTDGGGWGNKEMSLKSELYTGVDEVPTVRGEIVFK